MAGREALRAMSARSKGDGARVRDAATDLESGREEVEDRDPHRGIEPRCLVKTKASHQTWVKNYEGSHAPGAAHMSSRSHH